MVNTLTQVLSYLCTALLILQGCTSFEHKVSLDTWNRQSLSVEIQVNGEKYNYQGMGVVPIAKDGNYEIKIKPSEKIQRLIITTCHREIVQDKPNSDGWFSKSVTLNYRIMKDREDKKACLMNISGIHKGKKVSFAMLDFMDTRPEVNLPATIQCNGTIKHYGKGASVCQSASNLYQAIIFNEEVLVTSSDDCLGSFTTIDGKTYEYQMKTGSCTYHFVGRGKIDGKNQVHRLTTYGYTHVPFEE